MGGLYNCSNCGQLIAETASNCVGCGTPVPIARQRKAPRNWALWISFGGAFLSLCLLLAALAYNSKTLQTMTPEASADKAIPAAVASPVTPDKSDGDFFGVY
jgi:hypothetical protein